MYWVAEMRSRIFSGKIRFFTERLPKNFEYKVWKSSSRGTRGSGLFFVFFWEKGGFLLSVCRKNLNKGDDGLSAFIGGCQCRAPVGTGDFRKFLKFFLKTGAKTYPCLAITPIEGHLVAGFGWIRLFSKKAGKTLIVFKKIPNIRYGCFLLGKAKKGGDSGFWAETMKKTKDFRKKLRFLLSVCQKNLNIHNEQTARKDQLPAKRKEEWMQQTVKRIIKNGRTGMS